LSTTTHPRRTASGAKRLEVPPPAENSARSKPASASSVSSRTVSCRPAYSTVVPADRAEANGTTSAAGNPRSARIESNSGPTAPVAPTPATRCSCIRRTRSLLGEIQLSLEGVVECLHRLRHALPRDHAGHLDRRRGDHANVDAMLGQRLEHPRRHAGMALH